MAKKPNKFEANKDEDRERRLSEEEAALSAELVAEALKDQANARKELNSLIEESTAKEQEYFEMIELTNSMAKRRTDQQKNEKAFLADRNRVADEGTRLFYENLKSQTAQINTLEEIQTRETNLANLRQQISQNASGQNEEQKASRLQAIDLALAELAIKRDLNTLNGRTAEQLQHEADIERQIISYGNQKLKIYEKQDAIIEKVKAKSEGLVSGISGKLDKVSEIIGHIPIIGGALQGVFDKLKEGFEKKLKTASDDFIKNFTANIQSGKGVMESLTASAVGFRTVLMSLMKFALPVLALTALAIGFNRFHELENAALDFKKATGLAGEDVHKLSEDIRDVQMSTADLGTEIGDVVAAAKALRTELSPIEPLSKSIVNSMVVLEKNFGVTAENAAQAQQVFKNLGGMTDAAAGKAAQLAAEMATVAGLSADQIVGDIAQASKQGSELLNTVRGGAKEMTKMAVEARLMGSSLEKAADISKKLLDFETSITDELELSAVLGQNVNFGKARELAFNGKIVDAQREVLSQLSGIKDISQLNLYEKEALVKATGMEISELENLQRIDRKFPGLQKEKLAAAQSLLKTHGDLSNITDADLDKETQRLAAQERMVGTSEKLKNQLSNMALQFSDALVPLGKLLLGILEYGVLPVLQAIGNVITFITSPIDTITKLFKEGAEGLGFMEAILTSILGITTLIMARNIVIAGLSLFQKNQEAVKLTLEQRGLAIKMRAAAVAAVEMGRSIVTAIAKVTGASAETLGIAAGIALAAGAAAYGFFNSKKVGDALVPAGGEGPVVTSPGVGTLVGDKRDEVAMGPGILDKLKSATTTGATDMSSIFETMVNGIVESLSEMTQTIKSTTIGAVETTKKLNLSKSTKPVVDTLKTTATTPAISSIAQSGLKSIGNVAKPIEIITTGIEASDRINKGEDALAVIVESAAKLGARMLLVSEAMAMGATAGGSIAGPYGAAGGSIAAGIATTFAGEKALEAMEKIMTTTTPSGTIGEKYNENQRFSTAIMDSSILPKMPAEIKEKMTTAGETEISQQSERSTQQLLLELQALRSDLTAGKVAVYMNGNKVNEQLRATERKDPVTEKVRK